MSRNLPRHGDTVEFHAARQWLGLALLVLVLAGLFALAVVVGRMPPFDRFVTDPLFFKRCLVGHVNLALVAWFYSFVAALLLFLPGRRPLGRIARGSVYVSAAGVVLMLAGAGMPGTQPLLSNYIPTIGGGPFGLGQLLFALGVLASVLDPRLLLGTDREIEEEDRSPVLPGAVCVGLRTSAVALLLAAGTFVVTWTALPASLSPEVYYERLVWGGGHVLQLVGVIAMLSIWLFLLESALGTAPVREPVARLLFASLVVPWTFSLLLAAQPGSSLAQLGFTRLMQWGLFPVMTLFGVLCAQALHKAWRAGRIDRSSLADPRISSFIVSAGLSALGFGLGALIRGSNTMVPAHYHASVGAVTLAFMAATYLVLPAFRLSIPTLGLRRAAGLQPALYGAGMLLFSAGFGLAGAYGMGRKVYGAEQAARGVAETIGLGLMGIGGFVTAGGALLFLVVVGAAYWRGVQHEPLHSGLGWSAWRWRHGAQ